MIRVVETDSEGRAPFAMFGETRMVRHSVTYNRKATLSPPNAGVSYQSDLWVERAEDLYALRDNEHTWVVDREEWINSPNGETAI